MDKVTIITHKSPYELDIVKGCEIPALTRKNADFIEAVVSLDF